MSLYEAHAYTFYGTRVQRMGHRADKNPPLKGNDFYSARSYLTALGLWTPVEDWYPAFEKIRKGKVQYVTDLPTDHPVRQKFAAHEAAVAEQTFGCTILEMGSKYDADDWCIYIAIGASISSCGSEDDHGGFGETILKAEKMATGQTWDAQIAQFCAKVGVPGKLVKPRWTLSMRG